MSRLFRAPGRVNLIGEHTDYNDGLVLPVALDLACLVTADRRDDGRVVCRSENVDDAFEVRPEANPERTGTWRDYVAGVVVQLRALGVRPAASLSVRSEVPLGAGLSSSAALEVAAALALLDAAGVTMDRTAIAQLCQRAENEFVGAACGIMDQYVACHARAGTALLLDCRTLQHRYVPLPPRVRIVVCDTHVRHAHAGGEYNRRRAECRAAATRLGVASLRDASLERLEEVRAWLEPELYKRARHVITENERVAAMASALEAGRLDAIGPLMAASHESLRRDYEVSCTELDVLVESASATAGVHGSRMTGGGFGGCTVQLVEASAVDDFRESVTMSYERATGTRPGIYVTGSADAAGRVDE